MCEADLNSFCLCISQNDAAQKISKDAKDTTENKHSLASESITGHVSIRSTSPKGSFAGSRRVSEGVQQKLQLIKLAGVTPNSPSNKRASLNAQDALLQAMTADLDLVASDVSEGAGNKDIGESKVGDEDRGNEDASKENSTAKSDAEKPSSPNAGRLKEIRGMFEKNKHFVPPHMQNQKLQKVQNNLFSANQNSNQAGKILKMAGGNTGLNNGTSQNTGTTKGENSTKGSLASNAKKGSSNNTWNNQGAKGSHNNYNSWNTSNSNNWNSWNSSTGHQSNWNTSNTNYSSYGNWNNSAHQQNHSSINTGYNQNNYSTSNSWNQSNYGGAWNCHAGGHEKHIFTNSKTKGSTTTTTKSSEVKTTDKKTADSSEIVTENDDCMSGKTNSIVSTKKADEEADLNQVSVTSFGSLFKVVQPPAGKDKKDEFLDKKDEETKVTGFQSGSLAEAKVSVKERRKSFTAGKTLAESSPKKTQ